MVAEAARAGVELDLLVVRDGDKCPVRGPRVIFTPELFRTVALTETPQGVMAIARVREATAAEAVAAARDRAVSYTHLTLPTNREV